MRQQVFKLTLCQEVGRPQRKCFCKQGTPSSCIAGTLYLYIAILISVFSQSALHGWLAEVFSWWLQPCPAATAASQLWILPSAVVRFHPVSEQLQVCPEPVVSLLLSEKVCQSCCFQVVLLPSYLLDFS